MDVHGRDLRYFVAVAESRSFTAAAARLYVSQPALSKQIRQLEQQLGAQLLRRSSSGVALTPAGEVLLAFAREHQRSWVATEQQIAAAAAHDAEVLTVGFSTAVSRGLLSAASADFAADRPQWRIQVRLVPWHDPTAGLADAQVDVAVLWLPMPEPDRYDWRVLVTEPRHVMLPVGHRLAAAETVAVAELLDETMLALPESAGPLRDYWLATEHRAGRTPRIGGTVRSAEETFEAVANGVGLALLSAGNAEIYRHDGVVSRPVTGIGPSHLAVAWRRDDDRAVTAAFVAACATAARAVVGPPVDPPVGPSRPAVRTARAEQLTIGVSGFVNERQQRLLTAFSHTDPPVPVLTRPTDSTRGRVDGVLSGELDLAFVRLAGPPFPDLGYRHLSTEPLVLAVPRAHPLAGPAEERAASIPLAALDDQPLAFYHRHQNPWWYDEILARLRAAGAAPRIVFRGLWEYDLLSRVRDGRALALLTPTAAAAARLEHVVYRRLEPAACTLSLGLIWRPDAETPAVRRLLDTVDRTLPLEGGPGGA